MFRKIEQKLIEWKQHPRRKPLIIKGARQVGKTFSIKQFGEGHFECLIVLDFEKDPGLNQLFEPDLNTARILRLLEVRFRQKLQLDRTLLFLDEIQRCPKAIAALRYFFEEQPRLAVIAAGSLLEFELEKVSFPVGRVQFLHMFPLTFEEFLLNSKNELLLNYRPALHSSKPLESALHEQFINELKLYFSVGGMPEAVACYLETHSFLEVANVHENLVQAYIQDILKHEKNLELDSFALVFSALSRNIGKPIKYTTLGQGLSVYKTKQILSVLEKSLLAHPVRCSSAASLPLGELNRSSLKFVLVDIGLLRQMYGLSIDAIMNSKNILSGNLGSLCEQYVGQELMASGGSQNHMLYYWARSEKSSNAEVDYLMADEGIIFPLEVKQGPAGTLKSLHLFLKEHPHCKWGFVLNAGNVGNADSIKFRPLYAKLR